MTRKPVPRVPEEELPPYRCSECWYYDPLELDGGACYGVPPVLMLTDDGYSFPRIMVLPDDRGCHLFKPRHTA